MKKHERAIVNEWKEKIKDKNAWALRAALKIYKQQTEEEKYHGETVESNGLGFTAFDAAGVTRVVITYQRTGRISWSDIYYLRRVMPKYASQLYRIIKDESCDD